MHNLIIGQRAERKACRFLMKQGLRKITQNYRCGLGEIDLIMQEQRYLVFVEVRYRASSAYGQGVETVTYPKQQRIIKTALHFLKWHEAYRHLYSRFDVIGIDFRGKITWIKNAFTVQY